MLDINELDLTTASLDDLDALTMDDVLGGNLGDVELSNNLPDCVCIFTVTKMDLSRRAANPDENKKAQLNLNLTLKVVKPLQCSDSTVDLESLTGRTHFQRYMLTYDMGKQQLAKTILSILGISYKDKTAIGEIQGSQAAILEEIIAAKMPFGATIKNKESGGYENCDLVFSEKAFISSEDAMEKLD